MAYSLAYDGKFDSALKLLEDLKNRFPEDKHPNVSFQTYKRPFV